VAPDGRVEYIYTPIGGFEHLFKVPQTPQGPKEAPSFAPLSNTPLPASQVRQPQTPGKSASYCDISRPLSATGSFQHQSARIDSPKRQGIKTPRKAKLPARKAAPKTARRNVLKRSRSVAQDLSHPSRPQQTSDEDGNDHDDETMVQTESSRTFHVGDIKALKTFLRYRIDELTMKPVRGMVTAWLRQLEPKRKGGYGPYHKMLPCDAPADATPPWWPHNVPYVEPAHLDKDGKYI
jgi:hypothetical protein